MQIKRNNAIIADIFLHDNSFAEEEIMGAHIASVEFGSINPIELKIGDYIEVGGQRFKIRNNEKIEKRETERGWEYAVTFYASQYELQDVLFFLFGEPERKKNHDVYNGTAAQWLDVLIENMNRTGSGWSVGSVISSEPISMSFKDKSCADVLTELVQQLETEYWIVGKVISIGRREYANNGLTLGQGDGNGFKDLTLTGVDDAPPVTVLYPYGSDVNITADYGNDYLVLPGGALSLEKNIDKYGRIEQSKQFDHIFPKGEFHVSAKIDNYTLQASDIDFNLTDCLIDDVEVIVTFQGMSGLSGYDLAIVEGSWDNTLKQFKLKENKEENALKVPGDINFAVGDMFILTGLKMPQSYITAAENKLLAEATAYHDTICEKRVQLSGKCDDVYFRENNIAIVCGQMIHIVSAPLNIDRQIRCTRVKKFIENEAAPYRYDIVVSDFLRGEGLRSLIRDVENVPNEINRATTPVWNFAKRTYEQAKEAQEMLERAFQNFSPGIDPIWVRTMSVLIGNEYQQFEFVNNKTDAQVEVIPSFSINNETKIFTAPASILKHMTMGIENTSSSHTASEYKYWDISSYMSPPMDDPSRAYYLVAKCSKSGTTGEFVLEQEYNYDPGDGYYYFLVGILSSERNGIRSFATSYGFTEILPGQMRIKMIISPDGLTYFNIAQGIISGNIKIQSGSSGYNNLSDKPDLGVYETKAEFNVFANQISGTVTSQGTTINSLGQRVNTIEQAGFITTAQGNTLFARRDGIISAINQSPEAITISASKISLNGAVSFTMFDASTQLIINNKLTSGNVTMYDLSPGTQSYITGMATDIANKINASALKAFAINGNSGPTKSDLSSALQTDINGKLTGSGTLSGNKLSELIVNGQTLIYGGYIQTQYINVDYMTVNNALNVGQFSVNGTAITGVLNGQSASLDPRFLQLDSSFCNIQLRDDGSVGGMFTMNIKSTQDNQHSIFFNFTYMNNGTNTEFRQMNLTARNMGSDASWFKRWYLIMSHMPFSSHIQNLASVINSEGNSTYSVRWDQRSGCLYVA